MITHLGLRRVSLVDYPGRVAAVLFTHGCPLRCPFCHNPELLGGPVPKDFLPTEEVLAYLERRSTLLGGVVISGGEPLLHQDLGTLVEHIATFGYDVKIDTSGVLPDALEALLLHPGLDYVAMDIKTSPRRYHELGADWKRVEASIRLIRASGLKYQFRTTKVPGLVGEAELSAIRALLHEGDTWVVNGFRAGGCLDESYNELEMEPTA